MTYPSHQGRRIFDAHLHIIDPAYPLVENNGYMPEPFTTTDYQRHIEGLQIAGGAVVSGSFQAFDQGYLKAALKELGPTYVGVTQIPASTSDEDIHSLHEAGVRAVRFNVRRGGSATLDDLELLARRVHDIAGWHTELYIDARDLPDLEERLIKLPAISIDHLGMHEDGLPHLLRLVEHGAKVKATGFGRIELDPIQAIRIITDLNPEALMVGTDLPSTRARRPFENQDFAIIADALDPQLAEAVFWDNAAAFYLKSKPQVTN
ncbi:amidohydrolase family protein [Pseudarthrobacter enclensis]|uniref:amidohydrolase family protein n=1 Tax=Pseudarthrobacter enclensis TaxID=993070 RepID=UPI00344AD68A